MKIVYINPETNIKTETDTLNNTHTIKPLGFPEKGKFLYSHSLNGEQPGAPETKVSVYELPDGTKVERSCSFSTGEMGMVFSGFQERKL